MSDKHKMIVTACIFIVISAFIIFQLVGKKSSVFAQTVGGGVYSVEELRLKTENSEEFILLDVRENWEYTGELGNISGSIHFPIREIGTRLKELDPYRGHEIVVICRTDNRSRAAMNILLDAGFTNVSYVRGGMIQWKSQYGDN